MIATKDGFAECQILQNFVVDDNRIRKIGGTEAYNTSLGSDNGIPWNIRSYHIREDGVVSRTFAFYDGDIYYGDEVAETLTVTNATGFRKTVIPLSASFQVAGNSLLYFYTGEDQPKRYDGNSAFQWEDTDLDADIESGTSHLQRMWYVKKDTSLLQYSDPLDPETISDEMLVGDNAKDSIIKAVVKTGNERFFVFKNNSIWELQGRTPSTFRFIRITEKYGLGNKRAYAVLGGGVVFFNQNDKELHFFGGTEASITPLTEQNIKLREIMDSTEDAQAKCCMEIHKNFFRFAFQHVNSPIDGNDSELIYPIDDLRPDNLPKWSLIRGSNVLSYSRWTKYGDDNELVTGRTKVGKLMWHDRGNDFDGEPILTRVRTGEVVASEKNVVRFKGFFVKGKPSSAKLPITFRYYLNGRFSENSDAQGYVPKGETRTAGVVVIQQSKLYNDRVVPKTKYSRGNSISFEFEDNHNGTEVELYSVAFDIQNRYKIRNQYQ